MFGKLFGSKQPEKSKPATKSAPKPMPKAPPAPKVRKVNLQKRFTIIAETGQGSMSRVYKAMDNETGRSICLKVQDAAKTAAAVARAGQARRPTEGAIGVQILHPNVVRTYEHGDTTKG